VNTNHGERGAMPRGWSRLGRAGSYFVLNALAVFVPGIPLAIGMNRMLPPEEHLLSMPMPIILLATPPAWDVPLVIMCIVCATLACCSLQKNAWLVTLGVLVVSTLQVLAFVYLWREHLASS